MKKYGLVGFPLTHSFSKKYFTEKFQNENLFQCVYENFEIQNIRELIKLFVKEPELLGINITIPFKKEVIDMLDEIDPEAMKIGAVNTIKVNRVEGAIKLAGFNTDIIGFESSLGKQIANDHKQALILGTGGSSNAVAAALSKNGIESIKVSRDFSSEVLQYNQLTKEIILQHTLIINCTPLGMFPMIDFFPEIPYQHITRNHLLYDLIYNPEETVFLLKGKEMGAATKNGFEMLCIQAEASWKIWNEKE